MANNGEPITSCLQCSIGRAAGVGDGGGCRLVQRRVRKSTYLCLQGTAADRIYFVRQGVVSLSCVSEIADRGGRIHCLRGPSCLIGLEALDVDEYRGSGRAETDARLCSIEKTPFRAWLAENGAVANQVLRQAVAQSVSDGDLAIVLEGGSAHARVAEYILRVSGAPASLLPLPRWTVIADLLRMRPETLSRCLRSLVELGAIRRSGKGVRLVDPAKLRSVVRGELP